MSTFDPLAGLDDVRTYQERVMVRAVRLTRDNAPAIAKIARKTITTDTEGTVFLTASCGVAWAMEGDIIVAAPGCLRAYSRTGTDFRAWYTHPGQTISEEDIA